MQKYLSVLLGLVIIITNTLAQINIKIVVHTIKLNDSSKVFIAGNKVDLGMWNPGLAAFDRVNDTTWSREFSFEKDESIEFKFTLGEWTKEGLEKENERQNNFNHQVLKDTTLEYRINYWGLNNSFKGQITGEVKYHRNFAGKDIPPRDIAVLLPSGYSSDTLGYPVIYAHDGQNLFDPGSSSIGIDWQIDETLDSLVKQGRMKPVIVVGIFNTRNRYQEYSYTDSGYAYMNFIVNELKPFIDSSYRTLADRENTATLGSSMGGLISLMLLWEHTEVFSKAASFSPAFKIQSLNYLPFIENYSGPQKDIKLYIDNGGIGLEQELQPGIDETIELLQKKGYSQGKDFIVFYDRNASHNEEAWAKRIWRPLLFFFGNE